MSTNLPEVAANLLIAGLAKNNFGPQGDSFEERAADLGKAYAAVYAAVVKAIREA